jgi:cell division protein FtsA
MAQCKDVDIKLCTPVLWELMTGAFKAQDPRSQLARLGEDIFLKPVRRGIPKYKGHLSELVAQPRASTVMGLLEAARVGRMRGHKIAQKTGTVQSAFGRVKDWFVSNF